MNYWYEMILFWGPVEYSIVQFQFRILASNCARSVSSESEKGHSDLLVSTLSKHSFWFWFLIKTLNHFLNLINTICRFWRWQLLYWSTFGVHFLRCQWPLGVLKQLSTNQTRQSQDFALRTTLFCRPFWQGELHEVLTSKTMFHNKITKQAYKHFFLVQVSQGGQGHGMTTGMVN